MSLTEELGFWGATFCLSVCVPGDQVEINNARGPGCYNDGSLIDTDAHVSVPVFLMSPYYSCLQWPPSAAVTHREVAVQSRTQFSVSSIQLKCFTIFPFYLAFVIGFPVSQFSWQQREGENDSKYLIKIKCYDLISTERILSHLYEAFERVPESLTQSDYGPVVPSGYSKGLRNSRYHEIKNYSHSLYKLHRGSRRDNCEVMTRPDFVWQQYLIIWDLKHPRGG